MLVYSSKLRLDLEAWYNRSFSPCVAFFASARRFVFCSGLSVTRTHELKYAHGVSRSHSTTWSAAASIGSSHAHDLYVQYWMRCSSEDSAIHKAREHFYAAPSPSCGQTLPSFWTKPCATARVFRRHRRRGVVERTGRKWPHHSCCSQFFP